MVMHKQLFSMVIGVLLTHAVFSQSYSLNWGNLSDVGHQSAAYSPIGLYQGNFYTVQFAKGEGILIKIDNNNKIVGQKELVAPEDRFEAELVFQRHEKIVFITSEYSPQSKTASVQALTFDFDGKLLTGKPNNLTTVKVEKNTEYTDIRYQLSPDSSKLLIIEDHNMSNFDHAKFTVSVINTDDLKEIWTSSYTVDYSDLDFGVLSWAVDNGGNVLLLGVVKGENGKRLNKYSTRIFSIDAATQTSTNTELKIEGKFISSALIRFSSEGNLLITGFYNDLTESGKSEGIEGAFMCISDVIGLDQLDLRLHKIDPTTKAAIAPTGGLAKLADADELNAYFIRDLVVKPDGSGYAIAEQRIIIDSYSGHSQKRTFNFNHLIVYAFDANQVVMYITSIPKSQVTAITPPSVMGFTVWTGAMMRMGFKYNSYIDCEKDGNIYVLYNDHRQNGDARSMRETKVMSNKNNANAVIVKITPNGKWEKTPIFVGEDIDVILETSSSMPIENAGFLISAERKKNIQFGKIIIK